MKKIDIFRRDDFTCVYCGRDGREDPHVELSVDHVEPRVKGGDNSEGNLVTACVACNRSKGGLAAWAWLENRDEERERFLDHAPYVWPRLRAAVREAAEKASR